MGASAGLVKMRDRSSDDLRVKRGKLKLYDRPVHVTIQMSKKGVSVHAVARWPLRGREPVARWPPPGNSALLDHLPVALDRRLRRR